jgi:glycolate oxidase FAD binding subunit
MSGSTAEIQTDFASVVGDSRAITDPAACASFAVDGVIPKSVIYASSAEEVAAVLRCAAARDLAVIPFRNGTKLGIGAPPRRYDVALSLKDMNRVWYYEPDDLVVSVEPGMKFGDLQHFLARHRLWIPLDLGGGERASVGGILAANAAGPLRLHYGGPRDMVLGMKIATADGQIVKTGGRVVKNVAGYDLAKLLIGSYGTLGVIVEATFKLYPRIANRVTWVIHPGTLAGAREIRRELLRSPLHPLRMVLLNGRAQRLLDDATSGIGAKSASGSNFSIWIEGGGSDQVIARYSNDLGVLAAKHGVSFHNVDSEAAAQIWERIADFDLWLTREQQVQVVLRAALPIASGEDLLERVEKESKIAGYEVAGLVQMGAGIVELGLTAIEPRAPSPERRVPTPGLIQTLRDEAVTLGGTLVVRRCPAELKSRIDVWGPPGDDFEIMRKLKAAWDPKSTLSPGRFIGGL